MDNGDAQSDLLLEVIADFINTGKTPNPAVFRASHKLRIKEIDALEGRMLLQYDGGQFGGYRVPLVEFQKSKWWPRERRITNKVLKKLQALYEDDPLRSEFATSLVMLDDEPRFVAGDLRRAAFYLYQAGLLRHEPRFNGEGNCEALSPNEHALLCDDIDLKITEIEEAKRDRRELYSEPPKSRKGTKAEIVKGGKLLSLKDLWRQLEVETSDTKKKFAKRINFVKDQHKRDVIFRDTAHAQGCIMAGYNKPAVILAGGVIEELLRLYLQHKGIKAKEEKFHSYIEACQKNGLIKRPLASISDAVRDFRNLIHLEREASKSHAILRSAAVGAVHAIFTLSHDFQ